MTTLKPQLVRADTLDLQDHDAPSAKDHTRQPTHPSPYGIGPSAPHQNQALRNAEYESYQEQKYSPRMSEEHDQGHFPDEPNFYDEPEDELEHDGMVHDGRANGANRNGNDYDDGEQIDDDLDDDLMDKISSSPSISDGKYTLPVWPRRSSSIESGAAPAPFSTPTRGECASSSPFTSTPEFPPLSSCEEKAPSSHRRHGEYRRYSEPIMQARSLESYADEDSDCAQHSGSECKDIGRYLLPEDDPLLENDFDEIEQEKYDDNDPDWVDEDDLAVYSSMLSSDDEDDDNGDFQFTDDSRFLDSGWGGECLREIEDIDFEFVYALHTFVATVEGQANATKGDTMVLLDDSNSYWWLVRVVKDGSIGYLPAEHIETPTERLARLNKHRNIDLSAAMLGDTPEKSRNPLKKAMRRRNAKQVQFTAPTYYEPSDYDYSDEEEDGESQLQPSEDSDQADQKEVQQELQEPVAAPAPLKINSQQEAPAVNGVRRVTSDESLASQEASPVTNKPAEAAVVTEQAADIVGRSRNGIVRNTDSFFKDDSLETKKISLTPRLLRGDSEAKAPTEQDVRQRPSLETFDKMIGPEEKTKDDKKKKEKKGMLSGLFKRKDKTAKGSKGEADEIEKLSEESVRVSPQSKDSLDSLVKAEPSPERRPSKLQKQPPSASAKLSPVDGRTLQKDGSSTSPTGGIAGTSIAQPTGPAPAPPTLRPIQTDQQLNQPSTSSTSPTTAQAQTQQPPVTEKRSIFAPITTVLKSSHSNSSLEQEPVVKAVHSKRAKKRFAIDESDSEDDRTPTGDHHRSISPGEPSQHDEEHRAEPPVKISPVDAAPLVVDTSRTNNLVRTDSRTSPNSANLVQDSDGGTNTTKASPSLDAPTPSTSRSTPTWSDASLRSYMDNDQGIKDLLIIVHDSSHVSPVGPDHPLVGSLFMNERSRLAEMQSNLDSLLTGWISKKNASLLSR